MIQKWKKQTKPNYGQCPIIILSFCIFSLLFFFLKMMKEKKKRVSFFFFLLFLSFYFPSPPYFLITHANNIFKSINMYFKAFVQTASFEKCVRIFISPTYKEKKRKEKKEIKNKQANKKIRESLKGFFSQKGKRKSKENKKNLFFFNWVRDFKSRVLCVDVITDFLFFVFLLFF